MADDDDAPGRVPPGQPRGRTGTEPRTARSPLRLRLLLAVAGGLFAAVMALGLLTVADVGEWTWWFGLVLVAAAVAALVDTVVVVRRLRRRSR